MTRRGHGACRRGASLFELMAAMTAASVVMATSVGLVHRSFTYESRSRQVLADERTAARLARQFRSDVHQARCVRCEGAGEPSQHGSEPLLLVIEVPEGSIRYRLMETSLARLMSDAHGGTHRESYRFSRPVSWTASHDGTLISLQGRIESHSPHRPRLAVDLVAAVSATRAAEGGSP
jgi:hypothetical protein